MRLIDADKLRHEIHCAYSDDLEILEHIDAQPAAQPEIIRCKECKHSEHWYKDKRRCFLWAEDGIDVFDDGFCNYADKRGTE